MGCLVKNTHNFFAFLIEFVYNDCASYGKNGEKKLESIGHKKVT